MIYPQDFEKKVGFDSVRDMLATHCESAMGVALCSEMTFDNNYDRVERRLKLTDEMLGLIKSGQQMPSGIMHDMASSLSQLKAEGTFLTTAELYRLLTSVRTIGEVSAFFGKADEESKERIPLLRDEFAPMATFPEVETAIDRVLDKYGEVADIASPALADIRRDIRSASASMNSVMRRVLERAVAAGIVEADTAPSLRDGRLVIPVEAGKKRAISGIVHDESASGKTAYIEPVEVVTASNRLRELQEAEKREIHRILVETASIIRPHVSELIASCEYLGLYDFIRAKARLAEDFDAHMPHLHRNVGIEWYGAIHPVLAKSLASTGRKVVPLDLTLDRRNRILVISGPNAGGKSVCLKTTGVIQYMLQCGLLPSMYANSHAYVFSTLCIDIGDQQSIENDLSTYSSHLRNMKAFMRLASPRTLFLIDEMGSGTEPLIGGALAQSILTVLNRDKAMGIVTTHYQNLKTFADETDGIINGAMLYDRARMEPLFKLAVGSPGSSFALEIAHKTGLPREVVERAKEIVGSDYVSMDRFMLEIARDRKYWQEKRRSIKEKEAKLESQLERYQHDIDELKARRREIMAQAKNDAQELLATTNARVERTIREIRTAQAEKERTKQVRTQLEEYKRKVEQSTASERLPGIKEPIRKNLKNRSDSDKIINNPTTAAQLTEGSYVRMNGGGVAGRILSIQGDMAEVAFGALRTRVAMKKLTPSAAPTVTAASQSTSISRTTTEASRKRQLSFKSEIDLRGMRADEALQSVVYFLDDALQFGISRVRILHGTGTGALRMAIRQYLQSQPVVSSFRDEDVRFGGAGITVADLDV